MFRKVLSRLAFMIMKGPFVVYACLLGVISSLALPPVNCAFVLTITFPLLLEMIYNAPYKRRFLLGYSFGLGYFSISLIWIGNALLVEADKFAWLQPIALLLIPGVLAIYTGLNCALTSIVKQTRFWVWLTFCATWVGLELVRSWFLIPFPWNLIGYSASCSLAFSQFASVVGIYGLSFVIMLSSTVFFTRSWRLTVVMLASIALITVWGAYRLARANDSENQSFVARIVQPNFAEHHFGHPEIRIKHIRNLIELSNSAATETPNVIIWPEAVLPLYMDDNLTLKVIAQNLQPNSWLVSGADRVAASGGATTYYNSMISSNPQGELVSFYDKHMLVAFGEYIPLRNIIPNFIDKIAYGMGDFTVGKDYTLLDIGAGGKAIPLVCYEAVFSTFINNFPIDEASLLINVTNDSWFGDSLGPHQHLAISRFRAIEYGKPLVRVANSGISTAFDSYGKHIMAMNRSIKGEGKYIPLNERGYMDVKISTNDITTSYPHNIIWLKGILFMILLLCYFTKCWPKRS